MDGDKQPEVYRPELFLFLILFLIMKIRKKLLGYYAALNLLHLHTSGEPSLLCEQKA